MVISIFSLSVRLVSYREDLYFKIMNKKTEKSEDLWTNLGVKVEGKREDLT